MRFYYQVFMHEVTSTSIDNMPCIKSSNETISETDTNLTNVNNDKNHKKCNITCNPMADKKTEVRDKKISIYTEEADSKYMPVNKIDEKIELRYSEPKTQKIILKSLHKSHNAASFSTSSSSSSSSLSDFKSLRSNDVKFNTNYAIVASDFNNDKPKPTDYNSCMTGIVPHSDSKQYNNNNGIGNVNCKKEESSLGAEASTITNMYADTLSNVNDVYQHEQKYNISGNNDKPTHKIYDCSIIPKVNQRISSSNIIVTIPTQNRRNSLSAETIDNIAHLKTANVKKSKMADPNSAQAKKIYTISDKKSDNDTRKDIPKLKIELSKLKSKIASTSSSVFDATTTNRQQSFMQQSVNLTEYAEKIGLKPIKIAGDTQPHKDKCDTGDAQSHRKRKKSGKHSKESSGYKKRRLHAEISSQEEESLKLKVKITANKPSKHERKSSSSGSSSNSSDTPIIVSEKPDRSVTKDKLLELRQVRHKLAASVPNIVPAMHQTEKSSGLNAPVSEASSAKVYASMPMSVTPTSTPSYKSVHPKSNNAQPKSVASTVVSNYTTSFSMPNSRPIPTYAQAMSPPQHNKTPFKRPANVDGQPMAAQKVIKPPMSAPSMPNLKHISHGPLQKFRNVFPKPAPTVMPGTVVTKKMPEPLYYNSEMSSTYTKEITTKKPLPMLLPPSSISVTKMTDLPVKSIQTGTGLNHRPALEIVRISSTVPAVDQQQQSLYTRPAKAKPSPTLKVTRPLPPTIPLVRIKNAATYIPNKIRHDADGHASKLFGDEKKPLDLSGKLSPPKITSPEPSIIIDITSSGERAGATENTFVPKPMLAKAGDDKNDQRLLNLKLLSDSALAREKLTINSTVIALQRQHSLPKLNEITKLRTMPPITVRQQNASVRSIPNPSALAFRNQMSAQKTYGKTNAAAAATMTTAGTTPTTSTSILCADKTNPVPHVSPFMVAGRSDGFAPKSPPLKPFSSPVTAMTSSGSLTVDLFRKCNTIATTASPASSTLTSSRHVTLPTATQSSLMKLPSMTASEAKLLAAKKNLHIEQLAATLRTAAAAATTNEIGNAAC